MCYAILADIVVLTHFSFIIFVPLGGLLVFWRRWWAWLHVPAFAYGALISLFGWICPLTYLENWFRELAGEAMYESGFIDHYIMPLIYPEGFTRPLQIFVGTAVLLINALVYALALCSAGRRRYRGLCKY